MKGDYFGRFKIQVYFHPESFVRLMGARAKKMPAKPRYEAPEGIICAPVYVDFGDRGSQRGYFSVVAASLRQEPRYIHGSGM